MNHIPSESPSSQADNMRSAERRNVALQGRLTWKDPGGMTRFVSVVTRNVSEYGVYVECSSAVSLPLFRLVQFQLEKASVGAEVPSTLKHGRVLSAIYRVSRDPKSGAQGLALRLMVEPRRHVANCIEAARATA